MTRSVAIPIYAAALLAIGGMLATTQAAPTMLSTQHISDLAGLQHANDPGDWTYRFHLAHSQAVVPPGLVT